jgi:rRNA-processing protein FCF1
MATTMANRSTFVAVDTNFLLDLALPKDRAHDTIEIIRKRVQGVEFIIPPTVLDEIQFISEQGLVKADRDLATAAARNLVKVWRFRPLDFIPVGHGIVARIAETLRGPRLIPETEVNDSYILAEAALSKCSVLLTSDQHLRDADRTLLSRALKAADVDVVVICTPAEIVRLFG